MSVERVTVLGGVKVMTPVENMAFYLALRDTPRQHMLVERARQGDTRAKRSLEQFNYSCLPNKPGNTLKGATQMTNSVGMDIDFEEGEVDSLAIQQIVLAKKEELGLLMLERSVSKGFHLVFRRHPEMTQEENLQWASQLLGVPYDSNARDITRVFFATTGSADDLIFVSDELFDLSPAVEVQKERPEEPLPAPSTAEGERTYPETYDGVPYANIVEALADQLGGAPEHGSRNTFIFAMASHLRYICNDNPEWIARILPTYGEEPERARGTIQNACRRAHRRDGTALISRAVRQARLRMSNCACTEFSPMPQLPTRLPRVIRVLTSQVPDHYKPAVAMSVFPALFSHLYDVHFVYVDNVPHEPACMTLLIAPQSIGKGVVNEPINHIVADIRARDELNRQREQEWKDEVNRRGANRDKSQRPDDLCIQYVSSDMTNAAMTQRLKDANGRPLYCKMNEIELLKKLETKNTDVSEIIRLAFDVDDYGQERVGSQSVTCFTKMRWNWNASTTIERGQNFFKYSTCDGTLSRLNLATIIVPNDYDELIPVIGNYGPAFDRQLAPFIERLNEAQGTIKCKQAERLACDLLRENRRIYELSDDENFRVLSYRANLQAYYKAMLLYICNGKKWSREIEDFVRWSEQYDLWCKMRFFHEAMERKAQSQSVGRRGPRNMLEMMGEEFSKEEFEELRASLGKPRNGDSQLAVWQHRGYIEQTEAGHYVKTAEYLSTQPTRQ